MPTAPTEYAVGVDLGGTNLKVALVERTEGIVILRPRYTHI